MAMTETEHTRFAEELTNVHGLVCEDDGGDLCELMYQWTGVAAEYSRLLAAARAVSKAAGAKHPNAYYVQIPWRLILELRAAAEADRKPR